MCVCTRFANKTNIKAQLRAVRNIWEFVVFCQANITSFKLESFDPVKISLAASNSLLNINVRKALGKAFPAKIAFFRILKKGGGVQPMFKDPRWLMMTSLSRSSSLIVLKEQLPFSFCSSPKYHQHYNSLHHCLLHQYHHLYCRHYHHHCNHHHHVCIYFSGKRETWWKI